jgi:hypothetical protein
MRLTRDAHAIWAWVAILWAVCWASYSTLDSVIANNEEIVLTVVSSAISATISVRTILDGLHFGWCSYSIGGSYSIRSSDSSFFWNRRWGRSSNGESTACC